MSRFTLRALLVGVAFVALAIVSTMNANQAWVVAIEMLVYVLLVTAIAGVLVTVGERRAFWIGCAVFGWALWLAGVNWSDLDLPGWRLADVVASNLAPIFRPDETVSSDEYDTRRAEVLVLATELDTEGVRKIRVRDKEYYSRLPQVTRALLVIVAGVIGGTITAWMYRASRKDC